MLYLRSTGVVRREVAYTPELLARAQGWLDEVVAALAGGEVRPRASAFCVHCAVQDSCAAGQCPTITVGLEGEARRSW